MRKLKKNSWSDSSLSLGAKILITAVMLLMTASFLYPLYYMVINSFKDTTEYYVSQFALPTSMNFDNYHTLLEDFQILRYFGNSILISGVSTALVIVFSIFSSFAFAKIRFRGREIVYVIILATMFLPGQAVLIPQYVMFSRYHLINSYWSVILGYLAGGIPGSILLLRSAFMGIPNDLLESAKIDGAGYFSTVCNVAIPVTMAAISIQTIFCFISYWNDLLTPMLMLSNPSRQTVMVALSSLMSRYGGAPSCQLTGLLLSVLPVLVLYLFLQRYMMKGMLVGAVKA